MSAEEVGRGRAWLVSATRVASILLLTVTVAVLCSNQFLKYHVVMRIDSNSMAPKICAGDLVVIDHQVKQTSTYLSRGDRVAFIRFGRPIIKRVIGVDGDSVALGPAGLVVNGERPKWGSDCAWSVQKEAAAVTRVGFKQIFVLGDDLSVSQDSRDYGPIPVSAVIGRVSARIAINPVRCECASTKRN
jgi:signal peptidase I